MPVRHAVGRCEMVPERLVQRGIKLRNDRAAPRDKRLTEPFTRHSLDFARFVDHGRSPDFPQAASDERAGPGQ